MKNENRSHRSVSRQIKKGAVPAANTWTGQKTVHDKYHPILSGALATRDRTIRITDGLRTTLDKETEDAQPGEDILNDTYKQYIETLKWNR